MEYKVLPFNAQLKRGDTADVAAKQLQKLIDDQQGQGYEFVRLESITTNVAGTKGCLGFGAKPDFLVSVDVAVFRK